MTKHMSLDAAGAHVVDTAANPREFLSSIGIEIDAQTEATLSAKLAAATNGQQAAAIIHFDG